MFVHDVAAAMTVHHAVEPTVAVPERSDDDDLDHLHCCFDADVALCGADVSGAQFAEVESMDELCVVCEDLLPGSHCPAFGRCLL